MSSLPPTSKYRKAGKHDVVQTFDPFRHFGANLPRFQNYVNVCLANRFRTIRSILSKSPLCRAERLFLSEEISDGEGIDDRLCELVSGQLRATAVRSDKQMQDRLFVREFIDFVRSENPRILLALEAIVVTRTQKEAARKLRMTDAAFGRLCSQLRELGRSFLSRKARPQPQRHFERRCGTETSDSVSEISLPPAQGSVALSSNYWNRVELYNQVWNQPLVKLARKYGISDVRIGKVCRKLKVPHPGRGYWAKRTVGQAVEQVPLPEFKDAPVVRRLKSKSRSRKPPHWNRLRILPGYQSECGDHRLHERH
jgi:hypothetical protein